MGFVLDNSVALAWCFEDEQTDAIMALLDRVTQTGATAPQLWPIEALNGLLIAERRGLIDGPLRKRLSSLLRALPIAIDSETANHLWGSTATLAEAQGFTAYDATYLELARRTGVPLATNDIALVKAATEIGVTLLPMA